MAKVKKEILEATVKSITPAMAEKWLKNYKNIRPINWSRVEAFANDMRNDDWEITHQGLEFDEDGNLTDGGHRLNAVVRSGCTVKMFCVTVKGATVQDPIDRGAPRTIGHIIGKRAFEVSALNGLRSLEAGYEVQTKMTLAEANDIYEHHKDVFEAAKTGNQALVGSMFAAIVWAYPLDPAKVKTFTEQVRRGEHIGRGDPAYALRNWREKKVKYGTWEIMLATLNCVRYFLTGHKLASVYTGPMGYRAVTAKRRVLKVPFTPKSDLVPAVGWMPSANEEES